MKKFALSLISLLYFISLFSQAPQSFRYQTAVRNNLGELLADKSVGLKISILKNSPTGTLVFSETFILITNSLGLINLSVGTGSPIYGSIADIDWGAGEYYLRIDVDRNGGSNYEFLGTSQLQSVPYALYAEKAGSGEVQSDLYWKRNGDNLYYNDGFVGIGTTTPERKLQIISNVDEGVDREMVLFRNLSSSNMAYTGFALRADNNTYGLGISFTSTNYNLINDFHQVANITTNGRAMAISAYSPEGSIRFFTNKDEFGIIERMRIDSSGNIGIGTKTPAARLEIADGDIYIQDINKGIIMTSPNGQCWRGTIDNSGLLQFSAIPCP